ncbi:ParA family protein [Halobellus marinus]|uniref:ParA family protein n=1 Tax=Halobellus TaxID=1073986 RepID=UPI0028AB4878|nr:ParA family protein [Halobellus sp. DFY28]
MKDTLRAATFLNKGGVGKTTVAAHIGVACARQGHEVLLIDLAGKQGDLAKQFGTWERYQQQIENDDDWPNITTVFQPEWPSIVEKLGDDVVEEFIIPTEEHVDIMPAHPGLDALDAELGNIDDASERYSRFNNFLDEYVDPLRYDVILIDLPGVTNNISYNGLWAAQNVIAPVQPATFGIQQLGELEEDLKRMQTQLDAEIELTMVLPTEVDLRTKLSDRYLETIKEEYPNTVAPLAVPESQDIRNAAADGHTAFRLETPSETAKKARRAFIRNSEELIQRLQEPERQVI